MRVNRNYYASCRLIELLIAKGVRYFVISPGSRNTPLTLAAVHNKSARCYSAIDERGAAFFAGGIAREQNCPVALICTSGTAAAEYFPGIVEAFHQRIPLIVCTADRPAGLQNTGANQTIFQHHLYGAHTRFFCDIGLPELSLHFFERLRDQTFLAVDTAIAFDRGPVHLNFQFNKPFEPDAATDDLAEDFSDVHFRNASPKPRAAMDAPADHNDVFKKIAAAKFPLILAGPSHHDERFNALVRKVSRALSVPLFADIGSNLRSAGELEEYCIENYHSILQTTKQSFPYRADLFLILGRTMTSAALDRYMSENNGFRVIVNPFGDRFDPTSGERIILKEEPVRFLEQLLDFIKITRINRATDNLATLLRCDKIVAASKQKCFSVDAPLTEPAFINRVLQLLPESANVFLPNSLLYRDFDNFAGMMPRSSKIFHNRGVSGIDGNIAAAAGIALSTDHPTFLFIGDVAFYYDINSLWLLKKHDIPLKIILVNNRGGRIFDQLPVKNYPREQQEFFVTEPAIDFRKAVEAFAGEYLTVASLEECPAAFSRLKKVRGFTVCEVIIDPECSFAQRQQFRETAELELKKMLP